MAADSVSYAAVLKELWPQRRINNMAYAGSAVWALMNKDEKFKEEVKHIAFRYGNGAGRSATFSEAQASVSSVKLGKFQISRKNNYGLGVVDGDTLEATEDDRGALIDALDTEVNAALEQLTNDTSQDLWGVGDGVKGVVGSISTVDLTLASPEDAVNFNVDERITAAATATGALRDSGDYVTIVGINRGTGVLTADANWSNIASITAGDSLFVKGDEANTGALRKITGIPGYIPASDPSATLFQGLDRTTDIERLSGIRQLNGDTAFGTITESVKSLLALIRHRGGRRAMPKHLFFNPIDLDNLDTELGSRREFTQVDVKGADVGFEAIRFRSSIGTVMAMEDQYVPRGRVWAMDMRTWTMHTLKSAPRIIQHDGNRVLRQSDADAVELRAVLRGEPVCDAPGWNGTTAIPT